MKYLSVTETAKKWNLSERSVRNYGAFVTTALWERYPVHF